VLVGQPFDLLKVRLQIANLKNPSSLTGNVAESLQGSGAGGTGSGVSGDEQRSWRHLVRRLRFFYRGSLPPLLTTGIVQSCNFSGFEAVKRTLHPDPTTPAPLPVFWAAGCGGTLFVTLLTCPSQRLKILQQSAPKRIGLLQCVGDVLRSQGLKVGHLSAPLSVCVGGHLGPPPTPLSVCVVCLRACAFMRARKREKRTRIYIYPDRTKPHHTHTHTGTVQRIRYPRDPRRRRARLVHDGLRVYETLSAPGVCAGRT
jgi:hypothetical protein